MWSALKLLFFFSWWSGRISLLCSAPLLGFSCTAKRPAVQLHYIAYFRKKATKGLDCFLMKSKLWGSCFNQPLVCLRKWISSTDLGFLFYLPFFFSEIRSGCIPLIRDSQYGANWLYEMGFLNGTPDLFFFPLVFIWRSIYQIWGFCLTSLLRALNLYLLVYCISLRTKSTVLSLRDNILLLVASDIRSWLGLISVHAFVYVWSSEKQCVGEEEVWSCDSGNRDF